MNIATQILNIDFGLKTQTEYLKVDLIGYSRYGINDWDLKVAFEHENNDDWADELCKLCHVVADLRVIVTYHNFHKAQSIENLLQKRIDRLGKRITRVPDSKWLFIFGPRSACLNMPFKAFTIVDNSSIQDISSMGDNVIPELWIR